MDSDKNKQAMNSGKGSPSEEERAADQDREYGCRYCQKKFSNKQALGGHQNAHKVERAVEKGIQDAAYYEGPARMNEPVASFLGPYHHHHHHHRHLNPLQRPLLTWGPNAGGGGGFVSYGPPSSGWMGPGPGPVPGLHPFPGNHNYMLPPNPHAHAQAQAQNFGPGMSRPVGNQAPGFARFPIRPGNPTLRNVPGNQYDESGLDLSLKL